MNMDKTRIVNADDYEFYSEDHARYGKRLWILGNEYGALACVYADNEQDAFDEAADADMLRGLHLDADIAREREEVYDGDGVMYCGNASEPFDSMYAWIKELPWMSPEQIASTDESDLYQMGR